MPETTRPNAEETFEPEDELDESESAESADEADEFDSADTGEASPLREMVEYVARALTSNPDAVRVREEEDGNRTIFHLSVDEKDKGKVIGRDGRVAQSIRSLLRVAATKQGNRITLEID